MVPLRTAPPCCAITRCPTTTSSRSGRCARGPDRLAFVLQICAFRCIPWVGPHPAHQRIPMAKASLAALAYDSALYRSRPDHRQGVPPGRRTGHPSGTPRYSQPGRRQATATPLRCGTHPTVHPSGIRCLSGTRARGIRHLFPPSPQTSGPDGDRGGGNVPAADLRVGSVIQDVPMLPDGNEVHCDAGLTISGLTISPATLPRSVCCRQR